MRKHIFNTFRTKAALFVAAVCCSAAVHAQTWTSTTSFSNSSYTKEAGTVIGTSGSYSGGTGDDKTKVFDSNLNTFFDGPTANGVWAGLDLGAAKTIKAIMFVPREGYYSSRMTGGVFQASTDAAFTSPTTLFTIPSGLVTAFTYYYLVNSAGTSTRYIRYLSPNGGYGNIAEVAFYTGNDAVSATGWNLSGNSGTTPGTNFIGTTDAQPLVLKTNSTEQIRVSSDGNLGIGTQSPGAYLDIANWTDWARPALRFSKSGGKDIRIINDPNGFSLRNFTSGDGPIFNVRNTDDFTLFAVMENGQVGIGTVSPTQKLDVLGTVKATGFQLPVSNYDANTQYIAKADASGNFTWTPFRDLHQQWSNTWGAHVNCAGFKLVGAAGSTEGLTVTPSGVAVARGYSCDSVTTADFVFEPDYNLRPLHEVESFVKENKHLPDVPSAKEYQKRGQVDMIELQTILLQKVEELTLYVIQQHKENTELKNKLSELDKKIRQAGR
jgi:hypothetical protein